MLASTSLVSLGHLGFAGFGFLTTILLERELPAAGFAAISLFLCAFTFGQEMLGRGFTWAMLRVAPRAGPDGHAPGFLRMAFHMQAQFGLLVFAGLLVLALVVVPWLDRSDPLPDAPQLPWLLIAGGVAAWIGNQFWFGLAVHQFRERFLPYAIWLAGNAALRLGAFWVLASASQLSTRTGIFTHIGVGAATAIWIWFGVRKDLGHGAQAMPIKLRAELRYFGLWMVLATTLGALSGQADFFILDHWWRDQPETFRSYRVATVMINLIELVVASAMTVLLPAAGRALSQSDRSTGTRHALLLGGAIGALALLSWPAAQLVMPIAFKHNTQEALDLYPVLLVGMTMFALTDPLSLLFVSQDQPWRFAVINGLSLLLMLVLDLVWIPSHGAIGAAWARSASRGFHAVLVVAFLLWDRHRQTPSDPSDGASAPPLEALEP